MSIYGVQKQDKVLKQNHGTAESKSSQEIGIAWSILSDAGKKLFSASRTILLDYYYFQCLRAALLRSGGWRSLTRDIPPETHISIASCVITEGTKQQQDIPPDNLQAKTFKGQSCGFLARHTGRKTGAQIRLLTFTYPTYLFIPQETVACRKALTIFTRSALNNHSSVRPSGDPDRVTGPLSSSRGVGVEGFKEREVKKQRHGWMSRIRGGVNGAKE